MKRFALIEHNKVHQIIESEERPQFAPRIVLIDITDKPEVQEGWVYIKETGELVPYVWEEEIEKKRQEIAKARFRAETGGLTLEDGTIIATDRQSQSLLMGAALFAKEDPDYTVNWKGQNGWVVLDASTILQLAQMVRQHVQSCFDKEKQLNELIDNCTTIEELKNITWDSI